MYIADYEGRIIFTEQNVIMKCYDVPKAVQISGWNFNLKRGERMDIRNHNWILFKDCVSLSFSFMTLVMKDHHEENLPVAPLSSLVDAEAYNYQMNKQTFLTCDNFVG